METGGTGLQELPEETGGESEIDQGQETDSQEQTSDEITGNETTRQLVERAYREEKAKANKAPGDDTQEGSQTPEKTPEKVTETNKQTGKGKVEDEEIPPWASQPPARLTASEKEIFNKLPKKFKPAVARMFADHERDYTQGKVELGKLINENRDIHDAVTPYYNSHPELAEAGFTRAAFVASLIGAHARLSDPKTKDQAFIQLGQQIGFDFNKLADAENGGQNQPISDIRQHPEFLALQQQVSQLSGVYQQAQEQQFQSNVESTKAEFQAAMEEKDQFGRYKYPELHQESFWIQAKPLVNGLLQTDPGLKYGDAVKKAALILRQGYLQEPSQTGLPTNTNERALSAAVSVRGRTAPASAVTMPDKLPTKTRDIVQMVHDNLLNGRGG